MTKKTSEDKSPLKESIKSAGNPRIDLERLARSITVDLSTRSSHHIPLELKTLDDFDLVFGSPERNQKEVELAAELARLRKQLSDQASAVIAAQRKTGQAEAELQDALRSQEELRAKEGLNFVLHRIRPEAREALFESDNLRQKFLGGTTCEAYVMSIDIRRSTDLMLKARRPELFARFLSELCGELREIIVKHDGVFDKFTGDGTLAFFPEFYSGTDAGYLVVSAADAAHRLFEKHYRASRQCFISIVQDVGLGIGIDQGNVNLVQIGDGLTVVGTPVVYACRMGAAPPGTTLLNQPAYEKVFSDFSAVCTFNETSLDVKHEGRHIAYSVCLNGKPYTPKVAGWHEFLQSSAAR